MLPPGFEEVGHLERTGPAPHLATPTQEETMFALRAEPGRGLENEREGAVPFIAWINNFTREDLEALHAYLDGHVLLPERSEDLSDLAIAEQADLLRGDCRQDEMKRALIILAHHKSVRAFALLRRYLANPHPELERFALLAYRESLEWLRMLGLVGPKDPCPCESGLIFGECCGGLRP
jgi:hypothetical protein